MFSVESIVDCIRAYRRKIGFLMDEHEKCVAYESNPYHPCRARGQYIVASELRCANTMLKYWMNKLIQVGMGQ